MGLLDEVRSYFQESEQEPTQSERTETLSRQRKGDQFGDLPEEIETMPPEEVADTFARMQQQNRLAFIQSGYISQEKWNEMMTIIEDSSKQRDFWGLDGTQINIKDGIEVCACHEEVTQTTTVTKENQETIGQTEGTSESSKTEIGSKTGGSGEVGVLGVGNVKMTGEISAKKGRTQGETQQKMAQATGAESVTQSFHSCRIEPTDSTLSRRGFLKMGNIFARGNYDKKECKNNLIDDWEMDAERTSELEESQKGSDTPRAVENGSENNIEDIHREFELVNEKIENTEDLLDENDNH